MWKSQNYIKNTYSKKVYIFEKPKKYPKTNIIFFKFKIIIKNAYIFEKKQNILEKHKFFENLKYNRKMDKF